ncbi:MAG: hypothetical protein KGI41_04365, partial [Patescibacteria group bacterium]|nr:hypothetical protein [Patescibacteria group bacterium]
MAYVVAILVALALLIGFIVLTVYERARGARFFEAYRASLDAQAERLAFIAEHVDFPAFLRDSSRELAAYAMHEIVNGTLITVRALERLLTRAVRYLRVRRPAPPPARPENRSSFV